MFNFVGKKIKALAVVVFVMEVLISLAVGSNASSAFAEDSLIGALLVFFLVVAVGVIAGWISVLVLYGFGELVDQSMEMTRRQEETHEALEEILRLLKEQKGTAPQQEERPQPSVRPRPEYHTRPAPEAPHVKPETPVPTSAPDQLNSVSELDRKLPLRAAEEKPRVPSPEEETDSDEPELYIPEK